MLFDLVPDVARRILVDIGMSTGGIVVVAAAFAKALGVRMSRSTSRSIFRMIDSRLRRATSGDTEGTVVGQRVVEAALKQISRVGADWWMTIGIEHVHGIRRAT